MKILLILLHIYVSGIITYAFFVLLYGALEHYLSPKGFRFPIWDRETTDLILETWYGSWISAIAYFIIFFSQLPRSIRENRKYQATLLQDTPYRVTKKFAWKDTSVYEILSPNSGRYHTIFFMPYYIVEIILADGKWYKRTSAYLNKIDAETALNNLQNAGVKI